MYRFLLSPRWVGLALLTVVLAAVMVQLGNWQLSRYHQRSAINERIDAGERTAPVPLADAVPRPTAPGAAGPAPARDRQWVPVTVTGRYDSGNEILVRGRTVNGRVGFEVLTPLVLADGTAVLIDRGWLPAPAGDATAVPQVPAAPTAEVTVVGRVHLSESRPGAIARRQGRIEVRRVAVGQIAGQVPYPLHGAYLLLTRQSPPADPTFTAVPIRHENDWQNGGYAVQWWLFAALTLGAYGWLARREAHGDGTAPPGVDRTGEPAPSPSGA
ncbi:MAG TPA: SURF1 family protein [Catenuloplanes sp.]